MRSMAVEASHYHNNNREMIYKGNANIYDDRFRTVYGNGKTEFFPANDFKAESGVTSISRKRSRDISCFNPDLSTTDSAFAFLSNDISLMMYQQQLEIDRFVDHHNENLKMEIEKMRRGNARRLIAITHEQILKKLETKDEELSKIKQLNLSLEEKVKSQIMENQIWHELARTNEATANALRINLQQVLTQAQQQQQIQMVKELIDDCESYCGSNYEVQNCDVYGTSGGSSSRYGRLCRNCGENESCVLVLPCRHLCVCSDCGSAVTNCPVCKSTKSAGLLVNMN